MKFLTFIWSMWCWLLMPAFTFAANLDFANISEGEQIQTLQCPNQEKIGDICNSIGSRVEEYKDPDSYYVYDYQRRIYEASCADNDFEQLMAMEYEQSQSVEAKQLEDEIERKINLLWDKYEPTFKCNSGQFDVPNGSILKLAVSNLFREVLEDAVMIWKVNLNRVDESDKETVLDYVEEEIIRNNGNANERILKEYFKILREAGAIHRRELPGKAAQVDREENWVCWQDDEVPELRLCQDKIWADKIKKVQAEYKYADSN